MALLGDPPVTIAFSMIGVLGDYFLKLASTRGQPLRTEWFYLGFALYASTAFGHHQRALLGFHGAASDGGRRGGLPRITQPL